jgi:hypothetical protein
MSPFVSVGAGVGLPGGGGTPVSGVGMTVGGSGSGGAGVGPSSVPLSISGPGGNCAEAIDAKATVSSRVIMIAIADLNRFLLNIRLSFTR